MKNNEEILKVFQEKQVFNNCKMLNVGITVIFNKVYVACIKQVIACITVFSLGLSSLSGKKGESTDQPKLFQTLEGRIKDEDGFLLVMRKLREGYTAFSNILKVCPGLSPGPFQLSTLTQVLAENCCLKVICSPIPLQLPPRTSIAAPLPSSPQPPIQLASSLTPSTLYLASPWGHTESNVPPTCSSVFLPHPIWNPLHWVLVTWYELTGLSAPWDFPSLTSSPTSPFSRCSRVLIQNTNLMVSLTSINTCHELSAGLEFFKPYSVFYTPAMAPLCIPSPQHCSQASFHLAHLSLLAPTEYSLHLQDTLEIP